MVCAFALVNDYAVYDNDATISISWARIKKKAARAIVTQEVANKGKCKPTKGKKWNCSLPAFTRRGSGYGPNCRPTICVLSFVYVGPLACRQGWCWRRRGSPSKRCLSWCTSYGAQTSFVIGAMASPLSGDGVTKVSVGCVRRYCACTAAPSATAATTAQVGRIAGKASVCLASAGDALSPTAKRASATPSSPVVTVPPMSAPNTLLLVPSVSRPAVPTALRSMLTPCSVPSTLCA